MSVLIEGMEMPLVCSLCPFLDYEEAQCTASNNRQTEVTRAHWRMPWCPLIEIPPHGKLIDADKLIARLEEQRTAMLHELSAAHSREEGYTDEDYIFDRNGDLISMLRNQAAVIPADTEVKRDAETKTTNCDGGGDAGQG